MTMPWPEPQIGLFKSELIWPHGPWRDRDHLEAAVLDWVTWFNTERAHESIDDLTSVAAEELHYRCRTGLAETDLHKTKGSGLTAAARYSRPDKRASP
jgi:hypothetical protein